MYMSVVYAAMLTLFLVQNVFTGSTHAETRHMDDHDITLAVETELATDDSVPEHFIDVETDDGIVVLAGMVDNLLAKERARQRAERVKGVRAVVNELAVKPVERTDADVLRDVKQALANDPATDAYEVFVEVQDGVVTLAGTVDSRPEKRLSAQVAKGVKGVKAVKNAITINTPAERPDGEIKQEVVRRLASDVWVDDGLVTVAVQDGRVSLRGTVGSAFEKTRATGDAWVAGVRSVKADELQVKWWAHEKQRRISEHAPKTDEEIVAAIQEAFHHDARVKVFQPRVEIEDGVVTLTGTVDNLAAKHAAAQDARNTVGVWRVKNFLRVRPKTERGDTEIAKDVRAALLRDPYVERYQVEVEVINGRVYLSGATHSVFDKVHAEEVASRVAGVGQVVNNIEVLETAPRHRKQDWEIQVDVEDGLQRSPLLHSDRIDVSVQDGVVTLSGTVDTWREHEVAINNAYESGAVRVRDELKVKHGPKEFQS
jgi:osmotically-inducible protein OsmY